MTITPVNIISGFLGSGKTSAIIRLLGQKNPDEKWAIVVNEFGKVSIDGQTLQSKSVSGSVFDISGGCICCSGKAYLRENLEKIVKTESFDRIIIEPSGLGGIEMVTEIIESIPGLKMMPVVCMVDILSVANARLQMNMIYRSQIDGAKIIVFSKCDVIASSEVQEQQLEKFKTAFPDKTHCLSGLNMSPEILDTDFKEITGNNSIRYFHENSNLTDKNYTEKYFQFNSDIIFDSEKLSKFFNGFAEILRIKGYVKTQNGWMFFNFTTSGCTFEPCLAKEKNELVLIAEKVDVKLLPDFQELIEATSVNPL